MGARPVYSAPEPGTGPVGRRTAGAVGVCLEEAKMTHNPGFMLYDSAGKAVMSPFGVGAPSEIKTHKSEIRRFYPR